MLRSTIRDARTAIVALAFFTLLTGVAYPFAITGAARALFSRQADGSILRVDGESVGSRLIGQSFSSPAYFHGRPSAAGMDGYDASVSSGSNLGPSSPALADRVSAEVAHIRDEDALASDANVPVDAVTASGSGLDPHISPAYADLQVARVAAARGAAIDDVRDLVRKHTDGSTWRVLGEPRVNVLELNLALDERYGKAMRDDG